MNKGNFKALLPIGVFLVLYLGLGLIFEYAMKIERSCKIIVQYGRLDNRQTNLAYYTTLGY